MKPKNVSVVISEVPEGKTLEDLGTPTDVGYKLSKSFNVIAAGESDVELVSAQRIDTPDSKTYYILEYVADLPSGIRHNLGQRHRPPGQAVHLQRLYPRKTAGKR